MTWTRNDHEEATWISSLIGAGFALIWLGTDYWFFGLVTIACLVFAFVSWIKIDRR